MINYIKPCLFIFFLSISIQARNIKLIDLNGKETIVNFSELKKTFLVHEVEVLNFYTLRTEKYRAFDLKDIFSKYFGKNSWPESVGITTQTKDRYKSFIETYKFVERTPYLAFERADSPSFSRIVNKRVGNVKLEPFYLIWKEDYKSGDAARRRHHWVYQLQGLKLEANPPLSIKPSDSLLNGDIKLKFGYMNYLKQCFPCHSIHSTGGVKGGELILTGKTLKYSDSKLAKLIHDPQSVNQKSRMPGFPKFIDNRTDRIKNIVYYLRFMEKKEVKKNIKKTKTEKLNKLIQKISK